jgi:hypothetical protein
VLEQSCANWKTGSIGPQGGRGWDSLRYLHAERTPDCLAHTRLPNDVHLSLDRVGCIIYNQITIKRKVSMFVTFRKKDEKFLPTLNLVGSFMDRLCSFMDRLWKVLVSSPGQWIIFYEGFRIFSRPSRKCWVIASNLSQCRFISRTFHLTIHWSSFPLTLYILFDWQSC